MSRDNITYLNPARIYIPDPLPISEPKPLPRMYGRSRAWVRVWCSLAVIAIVVGALAALSH